LLEAEAKIELGREDVERKLGTTEAVVSTDMLVARGMEDDAMEDVGTDAVSVGASLEVSVGTSVEVSVGASAEVSVGASALVSVGASAPESVGASAPESVGVSAPASVALSEGSAEPFITKRMSISLHSSFFSLLLHPTPPIFFAYLNLSANQRYLNSSHGSEH
jgi:hypothetical protein